MSSFLFLPLSTAKLPGRDTPNRPRKTGRREKTDQISPTEPKEHDKDAFPGVFLISDFLGFFASYILRLGAEELLLGNASECRLNKQTNKHPRRVFSSWKSRKGLERCCTDPYGDSGLPCCWPSPQDLRKHCKLKPDAGINLEGLTTSRLRLGPLSLDKSLSGV